MKRIVLAAAAFAAAFSFSAAAEPASAAAATAASLPPRVVAPTHKAQFRRFTLDNGLRVLLVSDPNFNRSAAALVVNVGQIDDPRDTEGLAHFLEHMLFLGTEKYPDISEYSNYIRSNGGYNNAYTASDHTNYQFEVRHEALPGALDRFAQFFIAPQFNPEFVGREVNAVHNEAMRHVQNDFRRQLGVARELYDPASGESKFSTGNKDTLARANPAAVRAFYEAHYSADRMALALCGKVSLDELEKLARANFAAVPRRDIPQVNRTATFLARKPALRLALVEPIKEVRLLRLEFPIPATRPDFASKPDRLVDDLISYAGPGSLVESLKRDGLANKVSSTVWERTGDYGSFFIEVDLTPEGRERHAQVLQRVFAYLDHLRKSPFPAEFYAERARVAALNETYSDRGEGAALATRLANQALFYPLEVAERAVDVWGKPDEAAYRRLLAALTPDNMLASLMAKGVPTDRKERIYGTAYSYAEDAAAGYAALLRPEKVAFALPGKNPFQPGDAKVLAERPLALIQEPGLQLYYAQDTEFLRPSTTLIFRFVPVREIASAESLALLTLYEKSLKDFLEPALGEAAFAGTEVGIEATLEGLKITISGYGDSAPRFARYLAANLRGFALAPARFAAVKEAQLRTLRSYSQVEAYLLARDRRDALAREFHFLPPQLLGPTERAQWRDVQAFTRRFFARGKLEALVHGHLPPQAAAGVTRELAAKIAAAPGETLLRRRHVEIGPAESLTDVGEIDGVNSAFMTDYLLPDDSPATRAAAIVAANFLGEPFYAELRTRQQLGYIVGSSASASVRQRYFTFVVQSSGYAPDELRKRAEAYIATLPAQLAAVSDAKWQTLIAGARSALEAKPKSIEAKAGELFDNAYLFEGDWNRRQAALAALDTLTREKVAGLLSDAFSPERARRRVVLLHTKSHPLAEPVKPTFAERESWKATRRYQ
jgi:insulysin